METLEQSIQKTLDDGLSQFYVGHYEVAEPYFYALIKLDPHNPFYFKYLAQCHLALGKKALAKKCSRHADELIAKGYLSEAPSSVQGSQGLSETTLKSPPPSATTQTYEPKEPVLQDIVNELAQLKQSGLTSQWLVLVSVGFGFAAASAVGQQWWNVLIGFVFLVVGLFGIYHRWSINWIYQPETQAQRGDNKWRRLLSVLPGTKKTKIRVNPPANLDNPTVGKPILEQEKQ